MAKRVIRSNGYVGATAGERAEDEPLLIVVGSMPKEMSFLDEGVKVREA